MTELWDKNGPNICENCQMQITSQYLTQGSLVLDHLIEQRIGFTEEFPAVIALRNHQLYKRVKMETDDEQSKRKGTNGQRYNRKLIGTFKNKVKQSIWNPSKGMGDGSHSIEMSAHRILPVFRYRKCLRKQTNNAYHNNHHNGYHSCCFKGGTSYDGRFNLFRKAFEATRVTTVPPCRQSSHQNSLTLSSTVVIQIFVFVSR